MAYNPTDWQNLPDTTTPITKNRLNNIETGIKTLDNDIGISDYDNTATYEIGDYCRYNNQIYKCNTTISTAEDWTVAHWTETSIVEEIDNCADFINNLLKRTVLYDDANGTSSTITLNNDSFTNYDELEIMLNDFKFTKIKVVNQSTYFLQRFTIPTGTTFRTFCTSITINNNTITFGTQYFYDHSGYFQEFPGIKILKIIGYKK